MLILFIPHLSVMAHTSHYNVDYSWPHLDTKLLLYISNKEIGTGNVMQLELNQNIGHCVLLVNANVMNSVVTVIVPLWSITLSAGQLTGQKRGDRKGVKRTQSFDYNKCN